MNSSKTPRYDYQTRIQVPLDSTDATMLDYIRTNQQSVFSHKERLLAALRAYWLTPSLDAARSQGNPISDEELCRTAFEAIAHLEKHATMLYQQYCAKFMTPTQPQPTTEVLQIDPNLFAGHDYFQHRHRSQPVHPQRAVKADISSRSHP